MPIWEVAENHGMKYLGQISSEEVTKKLLNSKFAIDPSWADHYAKYCRTHINGFIIEAMLCGSYPVVRDYRGLKNSDDSIEDPLFDSIRAVVIPWDATPKEFANYLKNAITKITPKQYLEDTRHNFEIVNELFNSKKNAQEIIRLASLSKKEIKNELEIGIDSENVIKISKEIMQDIYKINLPINWETD